MSLFHSSTSTCTSISALHHPHISILHPRIHHPYQSSNMICCHLGSFTPSTEVDGGQPCSYSRWPASSTPSILRVATEGQQDHHIKGINKHTTRQQANITTYIQTFIPTDQRYSELLLMCQHATTTRDTRVYDRGMLVLHVCLSCYNARCSN